MDCVTDDVGHHMLKTYVPRLSIGLVFDDGNSSTRLDSTLSLFGSLMSIVIPLKYDRELNKNFWNL